MLRPCEAMLLSGHHMRMYQRRMRDKSSKGQTISWPTVGARVIASATLMNASQMRSEYYPNVGAHALFMRTFRWLARRFMKDRRILHNHLLCALAHFLGSNTLRTDTLFSR